MARLTVVLVLCCTACGSSPGLDAGITDAGIADAGSPDAGSSDAGSTDAGGSDGGNFDGGSSDAGNSDAGCLLMTFPQVVSFPDTTVGCRAEASLVVWNRCPSVASLSASAGAPFSVDAGVYPVAPGAMVERPVWFVPPSAGAAQGNVVLATSSAQQPMLSTRLQGVGQVTASRTDSWVQPVSPKFDVLFVVSDGPGMAAPQQALAQNLVSAWQYASALNLDVRAHVLFGRVDGGAPVSSNTVPNVQLGEQGQPTESCLRRAVEALHDSSWRRATDRFSVVCVQNTLEQPVAVDASAWLRVLDGSVFSFARFAPGCPADDAVLRGYADATGGAVESICGDAGTGLSTIFSMPSTFTLSNAVGGDGGVEVRVDNMLVPSSAFTFDASRGELVFTPAATPPPGATVTASYVAACRL